MLVSERSGAQEGAGRLDERLGLIDRDDVPSFGYIDPGEILSRLLHLLAEDAIQQRAFGATDLEDRAGKIQLSPSRHSV